jgi:hypothetical protein
MMKINSWFRNAFIHISLLICMFGLLLIAGCYSFTGGSVPDHLKTLYIAAVVDNSGFGNPQYKDYLNQKIVEKFQRDNSFRLSDRNSDARLNISMTSITDVTEALKPGEVESARRLTVNCEAEYYDAVYKKSIWKKNFSNYGIYKLKDAASERDKTLKTSLDQISDDILLAVVSGW